MADTTGHNVIIMLGSNAGDRKSHIDKAVEALCNYVTPISFTNDIDNPDFTGLGADYLNRLVYARTDLPLNELKEILHCIEKKLGRDRATPACVAIDIDIVIYGDNVIKSSEYTSPPCRELLNSKKIRYRN